VLIGTGKSGCVIGEGAEVEDVGFGVFGVSVRHVFQQSKGR
jgi:hypothetical protein